MTPGNLIERKRVVQRWFCFVLKIHDFKCTKSKALTYCKLTPIEYLL